MGAGSELLWIDQNRDDGPVVAAVAHREDGRTVYRYYLRQRHAVAWELIAEAPNVKASEEWFNHMVRPAQSVSAVLGEWLSAEAAKLWRATGGGR